jgi:phosphatidate cytidylyltransferase
LGILSTCEKKEYAPSITYALPLSFLYIISTAAALTALTQTLFFIAITSFFLAYFSSKEKSLENIAITTLGFIYIPLPLSCIIHIVYLSPENSGVLWCAYLFAVTKLTDTGAFFIGKSLGRKPLALNLSPSKSIEGAIGGTIAGTLVSYAFFHFQIVPISALQSIFLGVLLSTTAQLGDLAESLIKRDANVKDSNKIPGLGGVLDTFDSLIPTAPILYLFLGTIS